MPKKAVVIYLLLALLGAAIFIYFTFPRTKDEIPKSNNQRPFPSAPEPGGVPVPENIPHPDTPKLPPGPKLRVMAWASPGESKELETEADAFQIETGRAVSLTIESDPATYRHDLPQAIASATPPDVCLISARDFSGLDPSADLAAVTPSPDTTPRSIEAFTVGGEIRAVPDEFSVDLLFYNSSYFDQAGIGYPDRHWTWDILESISRALASLKLSDPSGQPIYSLEIPVNFDFWNVLCAQAGHPALDLNVWHLADTTAHDSQVRALDFFHNYFQELTVAAPPPKPDEIPGHYFAQQRSALLIAPSDLAANFPKVQYGMTVLPEDMARATIACVNGWAVLTKSTQPDAARALALYLSAQPVHAGWTTVQKPPDSDTSAALCQEALGQALLPRIESGAAPLVKTLDHQINVFARTTGVTSESFYAQIQAQFRKISDSGSDASASSEPTWLKPNPRIQAAPQLRGP
ncbi:MAG: extracellular solute-binding protein [Methylacidiphilales bacterium]|nr:extracellular solute-binding protein [Candidatus Methylacidiphilales bacterium]